MPDLWSLIAVAYALVDPPTPGLVQWLQLSSPVAALGLIFAAWKIVKSGEDMWLAIWRRNILTEEFEHAVWRAAREQVRDLVADMIAKHDADQGSHRVAIGHQAGNIVNQAVLGEFKRKRESGDE